MDLLRATGKPGNELNMKKFCRPLKLLILPVLLVHATLAFPQQENILNIYNWSDYIDPETISAFEEEYDIKVNYDIYDLSLIHI